MPSSLSTLRTSLNEKLNHLETLLSNNPDDYPHLFEARPYPAFDDPNNLPPQPVFDLVEKIRVDLHALDALITPTRFKLVELGMAQYKAAVLNAAVQTDVAGAIEAFGGEATLGELARKAGMNEHKLGRVLRTLTGEYVFVETERGVFRNSRHSVGLRSPGARSFLSFITDLGMKCAVGIPRDMLDPETKDSFAETTAPFTWMVGDGGRTFAEYMGDPNNAAMVTLGGEGIVGWLNQLTRSSLINDYPWQELGKAKVIDLGAGAGDSGIDVMRKYPELTWVYQDLEPVIETLQKTYPDDMRHRVDDGSISFVVQDYFTRNASDGNVWYMRGVLHEYNDDQVSTILGHLTEAMCRVPGSRMLINEVLNSSPMIIPSGSIEALPSDHIPNNQSALASMGNVMTWSTFSLFGGKERSYQEYERLLDKAGLRIDRFFRFRTFTVMLECVLV